VSERRPPGAARGPLSAAAVYTDGHQIAFQLGGGGTLCYGRGPHRVMSIHLSFVCNAAQAKPLLTPS